MNEIYDMLDFIRKHDPNFEILNWIDANTKIDANGDIIYSTNSEVCNDASY